MKKPVFHNREQSLIKEDSISINIEPLWYRIAHARGLKMRVAHTEKILPCIADPWKLRIIAQLDEAPDLALIARYLDGKYSEKLGMAVVRSGIIEMNFFQNGQVTIRMVDSETEAIKFVNRMLATAYHKAMIAGDL